MEFFRAMNIWHKRAIAVFIGAAAGFSYYYFIGCVSGTCPITSNPYLTTGYGMLLGYLFIDTPKKESKESDHGNNSGTTDQKI